MFLSFVYSLFVDFALNRFSDIDTPTGELGRKACILTVFADGQGQLPLGNRHNGCMVKIAQFNFERFNRAKRVGYKGRRVGAPLDDVNLLIVEFMHNVVDASAAHANARANRV